MVGQQIEVLLGYGADQFRQIVLLPQGKFETFLAERRMIGSSIIISTRRFIAISPPC